MGTFASDVGGPREPYHVNARVPKLDGRAERPQAPTCTCCRRPPAPPQPGSATALPSLTPLCSPELLLPRP
eukprot:7028799-Prymnesium_polylepis.1